jgi:7-cyano-7-deazaguanine synthase
MIESLKKKAVVLLSGGVDSSVSLAVAKSGGFEICALTILYGQRHRCELNSAKEICKLFDIACHKILEVNLGCFGASALTDNLEVPKNSIPGSLGIPITYVPARNTVFLSLSLSFAESMGAKDIFIGVSSVDYSGYPDCRPEFIEAFEILSNLGTRAVDDSTRFVIHTPVMSLTKGETILLGKKLGVDFSLTWSCYDPALSRLPCGTCEACQLRAKGFMEAGIQDPLISEVEK